MLDPGVSAQNIIVYNNLSEIVTVVSLCWYECEKN